MVKLIRGNQHRQYFLSEESNSVISIAKNDEEGRLDTQMSELWSMLIDRDLDTFYTATRTTDISQMDTEVQSDEFKGRCTQLMILQMLPIDCVVRAYLTGSIWEAYRAGAREIGGVELPDGMVPNQELPELIFTPAIVRPDGKHQLLSIKEMADLLDSGTYIGRAHPVTTAINIKRNSLEVFRYCSEYAKIHGVIIADACFQYGVTYNNSYDGSLPIYLGDDLITTDSARLWTYKQYQAGCEMIKLRAKQACSMLAF